MTSFVSKSGRLSSDLICPFNYYLTATELQVEQKAIMLILVLRCMYYQWFKTLQYPSSSPSIRLHAMSTPSFIATNYSPNTDVSVVDTFLDYQLINDVFILIMNLVLDLIGCLSLARLLSTNICRSTHSTLVVEQWVGLLPMHPH